MQLDDVNARRKAGIGRRPLICRAVAVGMVRGSVEINAARVAPGGAKLAVHVAVELTDRLGAGVERVIVGLERNWVACRIRDQAVGSDGAAIAVVVDNATFERIGAEGGGRRGVGRADIDCAHHRAAHEFAEQGFKDKIC